MSLRVLAYDLKRVMKVIGFAGLMAAVTARKGRFTHLTNLVCAATVLDNRVGGGANYLGTNRWLRFHTASGLC